MRSNDGVTIPRPPADGVIAALFPELASGRGPGAAAIAAWAGARETARLRVRASAAGAPFVLLAEGLLRAPPRGRAPPPCLSALAREIAGPGLPTTVVTPGRILANRGWETPVLLAEAAATRRALAAARIGGAWWHGGAGELPAGDGLTVVALAELAFADAPGRDALPGDAALTAMLDAALADNPVDRVVILASGAIGRRLRPSLAAAAALGAAVVGQPLDPWFVLERAARVYSAGGEIGLLALIAGVPVAAFGGACYAGWGVTDDAPGVPAQPFRRTVDEIFAGICLVATRYRDPFHDRATNFAEIVDVLADWRKAEEANRRIAVCVGMSFWKRRRIAEFVHSSAGVPVFRRTVAGALAAARHVSAAGSPAPRAIAGWASRLPDGLSDAAARRGVPLIRVEDGFIRSVGLGSDFLPPASLVFDSLGMYYDPRIRSNLEVLLAEAEFAPALVARATRLAALLVARGITKYNLAGSGPRLELPAAGRRILVPGQVEDDLSLQHGAGQIRTNLALLAEVRAANPDAFILYKPHPDVMAGHRTGAVPTAEARHFADAVVTDVSIAQLLGLVDELHTMTSLSGFEALLRGRRVVVHGRPFYAGWGLTIDQSPIDRGRRLTLAELVAGVLILYPRYLDPLTRLPCGPEVVIERLDHPELWRPGPVVLARRLQGAVIRRFGEFRAMVT